MKQQLLPSPRITDCRWGSVSIDGHGAVKDAKLYPGGARAWDWGETGTHHDPGIQPADVEELLDQGAEVVVLSKGILERLQVCPETLDLLRENPDAKELVVERARFIRDAVANGSYDDVLAMIILGKKPGDVTEKDKAVIELRG